MRQDFSARADTRFVLVIALLVLSILLSRAVLAAEPRHRIELLGSSFDPLVDGEPVPPPALRAKADSAYALLQLSDAPKPADLDALRAAGVVFHDPIAGNAYLVRLHADGAEALAAKRIEISAMRPVRWIGSLHGAYKIAPRTSGGRLLLDVFPDADLAAVEAEAVGASAGHGPPPSRRRPATVTTWSYHATRRAKDPTDATAAGSNVPLAHRPARPGGSETAHHEGLIQGPREPRHESAYDGATWSARPTIVVERAAARSFRPSCWHARRRPSPA